MGIWYRGMLTKLEKCVGVEDQGGSWLFDFQFSAEDQNLIIEKGSLCINGTSLTVFNVTEDRCRVAIIPYTYEHTNFHQLQPGDQVNLEFDMIGKYVANTLFDQKQIACGYALFDSKSQARQLSLS